MVVLLTGGSGTLGKELRKHIDCLSPSHSELDITDGRKVKTFFSKHKPHLVIHTAALTDVRKCETEKELAYDVNVNGTRNIFEAAAGTKIVYVSTDYVFDGEKGNYSEGDAVNPVNYYALTKLLGEEIIKCGSGNLVIRTSFVGEGKWPYPNAFADKFTSADTAPVIAAEIARAIKYGACGLIHIGTGRKSTYDLARKISPEVGKNYIRDMDIAIPKDTSLNTDKWKRIKHENEGP
jgi:dTDP-4-dehydrorhamnose reductase